MRVAVTGVSGFIGSELARQCKQSGHVVTGLVRPTSRRDHLADVVDRFVVGTQADEAAWGELLRDADCVIHNSFDWSPLRSGDFDAHVQSNLVGSLRLLEAANPRQFIFISTIAVHHDMRPRWQGRIDEDHPLRPAGIYGAYKAAVEAHLWAAHFGRGQHTCAIRPCGVYGIDPDLSRSIGYPIIEKIRDDRAFNKEGGGKFVHVEDVARAAVACIANPDAAGHAFNLVDCYARWADLAVMAADVLGLEADIDLSSPAQPKNQFSREAVKSLGVDLDRGHAGLRKHIAELADMMAH